ncbi:hypothetical protein U1Q18_033603 [Sarracenia purpurea var. burkii]
MGVWYFYINGTVLIAVIFIEVVGRREGIGCYGFLLRKHKMLTDCSHLHEKSISAKDTSFTNSSVEVYHGGARVSVPFLWESKPGTPKVKFCEKPLPPLIPPPSLQFDSNRKPIKRHSKLNLLHAAIPKLNPRRNSHPPSPASSSVSSSSWPSSPYVSSSSPFTPPNSRGQFQLSCPRSPFSSRIGEEDECGSPDSTLCFGTGRGKKAGSHCCLSNVMKVVLREFA